MTSRRMRLDPNKMAVYNTVEELGCYFRSLDDRIEGLRLTNPDPDVTEYLSNLGIGYGRARDFARKWNFVEFAGLFDSLETLLGDYVKVAIKDGKVLNYKNGSLDTYLRRVREVAGKIGKITDQNINVFFTIEDLNMYLNSNEPKDTETAEPDLTRFRILNSSYGESGQILDELISKGQAKIDGSFHWNNGRTPSGPRGCKAVKDIVSELNRIAAVTGTDLGVRFMAGQQTVVVQNMEVLSRLRDLAYRQHERRKEAAATFS